MKNKFISVLCGVLFLQLLVIGSATAARSYVDFTDMWADKNRISTGPGWGVNIVQSGSSFDFLWATFFIYDPVTGAPTWLTAQLSLDANSKSDVFTGNAYESHSLPTSTAFDPQGGSTASVGTMTITFSSPTEAKLEYTMNDGKRITKNLERLSLTPNVITGTYYGSALFTYSTCADPVHQQMRITVEKSSGTTTFILTTLPDETVLCNLKGTLKASGRTAKIDNAKYICQNKTTGKVIWDINADVSNIVATTQGIEGEWITTKKVDSIGCKETGRFSAILY